MTLTQEQRQTRLTREAIAALVRAAIDEGFTAYRMQYNAPGYTLEARLVGVTTSTTGALDLLLYETLVQKGKHPAWPALVAIVEATHKPSSYVKDFYYHDREALEQKQPRVFAWATRETGTWLFTPGTGRDSCLELARAAQGSGQAQCWYWWNGQTLTEVDAAAGLQRLRAAESTLARREQEGAAVAAP